MFVISGCATVWPDYFQSEISVSTNWHAQIKNILITQEMGSQALASWWPILNDQ
jgi:hypothetical protein